MNAQELETERQYRLIERAGILADSGRELTPSEFNQITSEVDESMKGLRSE